MTIVDEQVKTVHGVPSLQDREKPGKSSQFEGKFSPMTVIMSPPAGFRASGLMLVRTFGTTWNATVSLIGTNPLLVLTAGSHSPKTQGVTRLQMISLVVFEIMSHRVWANLISMMSSSGKSWPFKVTTVSLTSISVSKPCGAA